MSVMTAPGLYGNRPSGKHTTACPLKAVADCLLRMARTGELQRISPEFSNGLHLLLDLHTKVLEQSPPAIRRTTSQQLSTTLADRFAQLLPHANVQNLHTTLAYSLRQFAIFTLPSLPPHSACLQTSLDKLCDSHEVTADLLQALAVRLGCAIVCGYARNTTCQPQQYFGVAPLEAKPQNTITLMAERSRYLLTDTVCHTSKTKPQSPPKLDHLANPNNIHTELTSASKRYLQLVNLINSQLSAVEAGQFCLELFIEHYRTSSAKDRLHEALFNSLYVSPRMEAITNNDELPTKEEESLAMRISHICASAACGQIPMTKFQHLLKAEQAETAAKTVAALTA